MSLGLSRAVFTKGHFNLQEWRRFWRPFWYVESRAVVTAVTGTF